MRSLRLLTSGITLASGASALALPPPVYGLVPESVSNPVTGKVVPELELELWADVAVSVTAAKLYAATQHTLVVADQTTTFAAATDKATHAAHGLLTGDGPLFYAGSGVLPPEVVAGTGYYVVKVDANTYKLATTLANALSSTTLDLTADSSGTITASDSADTSRIYWHTHDSLLGLAGDGAISLASQIAYSKRIPHSPRAVAYALVATLDTGSVSAVLYPIQDAG